MKDSDLNPEADADKPMIAVYTYDAGGERSIKYVPGRLDARYSAKETGNTDRLESMLCPPAPARLHRVVSQALMY